MPAMRQSSPKPAHDRWACDPGILLQSIPSAVFSLDERLRFHAANPAAEQLFSASWNVLAGRGLEELVAPHATILALARQVQATGSSISDYGVELALALFAWKRFGVVVAMLGGAFAAVLELTLYEWWVYMPEYTFDWRLLALGFAVVSGVLIGGVGGWAVTRALAAAGALDSFPPGREHQLRAPAS